MPAIVGLQLKPVSVNAWVDWVFVQVLTDDGTVGLGELSVRPKLLQSLHPVHRAAALFAVAVPLSHARSLPLQAGGLAAGASCQRALACLSLIERELRGKDARDVVALTTPLLARGTAPPPEAGADKGADKVWLVAVVTSHAIPATPPPPGLPRT